MPDGLQDIYTALQKNQPSLQKDVMDQLPTQADIEEIASETISQGIEHGQYIAKDATQQVQDVIKKEFPHAEQLLDSAQHAVEGISTGVERGDMTLDITTNSTISADPHTLEVADKATDILSNVTDPDHIGNMTSQAIVQGINTAADMTGIYTRDDLLELLKEGASEAGYHAGQNSFEGAKDAFVQTLSNAKEEIALATVVLLGGIAAYRKARKNHRMLQRTEKSFIGPMPDGMPWRTHTNRSPKWWEAANSSKTPDL